MGGVSGRGRGRIMARFKREHNSFVGPNRRDKFRIDFQTMVRGCEWPREVSIFFFFHAGLEKATVRRRGRKTDGKLGLVGQLRTNARVWR